NLGLEVGRPDKLRTAVKDRHSSKGALGTAAIISNSNESWAKVCFARSESEEAFRCGVSPVQGVLIQVVVEPLACPRKPRDSIGTIPKASPPTRRLIGFVLRPAEHDGHRFWLKS